MISAAVPSVQIVPVPVLLCLKGTCGEDTQGHLPSPLLLPPCKRCPLEICLLQKEWRQCRIFTLLLVNLGLGLYFRICRDSGSTFALYNWAEIPAQSCVSAPFLSRNTCFSLVNALNPIGSPAYALFSGWFLVAENLPWSWSCGAGYSSLMLLDFQMPAIVNSFEIFTKTKLPFALKRTSSLGHEFTSACRKKSLFLLLSGWSGWLVFRLSQMVIKMDGAPVLASCHFTAFPVLSRACFPSPPPWLQGQKISQKKRFSLAKCLSEVSQVLWND